MGVVDGLQDAFGLGQHLVVPEPDDPIAPLLKPLAALLVVSGLLQVLPTIQFHDQCSLQADEVNDRGTKRVLSAELAVEHLPPA